MCIYKEQIINVVEHVTHALNLHLVRGGSMTRDSELVWMDQEASRILTIANDIWIKSAKDALF